MTTVATFGATPVPSEAVAIPPKQHRNFRIEDDLWLALARISELRNERTSDVMRDLVKSHVAKYRKLIADDPVLAQRIAELREQRERRLSGAAADQQERAQ
jgi:hypothetical protein